MANVVIDRIERAPGMVGSEQLVLVNLTNAVIDVGGWSLQTSVSPAVAPDPFPANTRLDANGTLQVITGANPNGRNLPDPPGLHYLKMDNTLWDRPGGVAVLLDAAGVEQSRFGTWPLPPHCRPSRIVVPAYFDVAAMDQWQLLAAASTRADVIVLAHPDWPGMAAADPVFAAAARDRLSLLTGRVLGTVKARPGRVLLTAAQLGQVVDEWYGQFGLRIDGIYLDDLVQAETPGDTGDALALKTACKQARPSSTVMINANRCTDPAVISTDLVVLWEGDAATYQHTFQARQPGVDTPVPSWWRNNDFRDRIVHLVHSCVEPDRQPVLGLANERNAGNFYVTDSAAYDRLPPQSPYWNREVIEANSNLDFGLDPLRTLEAASIWGAGQTSGPIAYLHGWPTGEQVWTAAGHVHGTFLLKPHTTITNQLVTLEELRAANFDELAYDVAAAWEAAQQWAEKHSYKAALPTFRLSTKAGKPAMRLFLISSTADWLQVATIPRSATYQQPSYNEVLTLLRNLGRVPPAGYWSVIPTFAQTGPIDIPDVFTVMAFTAPTDPVHPSPIDFQDALTVDYIRAL